MSRRYHQTPGARSAFWDRTAADSLDDLDDLVVRVIEALAAANHSLAQQADDEFCDVENDSQKKAWLAVYGPLTDVLPES
jgi:hypothetical protein